MYVIIIILITILTIYAALFIYNKNKSKSPSGPQADEKPPVDPPPPAPPPPPPAQAGVTYYVTTPRGFSNPNGKQIAGEYTEQSENVNGKTAWKNVGGMYLRWASMWNQWIFDDDLVDNTSVAWKSSSPTNSTSPEVGSFSGTWRFGSTSGNNGVPVPLLVIKRR